MAVPARSSAPSARRAPAPARSGRPAPAPGARVRQAPPARRAPASRRSAPAPSPRRAPARRGAAAATARANATLRAVRDGARAEAAARRALPAHEISPTPSRRGARPRLVVVPRRRTTARLAATAFGVVFLLMLSVVAFQTQLAQNQLELDRVEQQLDIERSRTRELRRDNAALRSPDRIAAQAQSLGLVPTGSREFVQIPADVVNMVTVAAGGALDEVLTRETDAFRDYQETKHLVAGHTP